jgi:GMP synthase-like glutamine amidotransferase
VRILILEQQPDAPAQLFGEWARARGHELEIAAVPELSRFPPPRQFDAVLSLGSECSVHGSPDRWIPSEVDYLRDVHATGVPILGICFGAQALAKALGGEVGRADRPEVSWRTVDSCDGELIPPGPWFRWHYDRFTAPAGARLLARNGDEVDAFAVGRSVGVQFHPEVDVDLAERWIEDGRADLRAHGVDLDLLEAQITTHGTEARSRAFALFDRIESWWGP